VRRDPSLFEASSTRSHANYRQGRVYRRLTSHRQLLSLPVRAHDGSGDPRARSQGGRPELRCDVYEFDPTASERGKLVLRALRIFVAPLLVAGTPCPDSAAPSLPAAPMSCAGRRGARATDAAQHFDSPALLRRLATAVAGWRWRHKSRRAGRLLVSRRCGRSFRARPLLAGVLPLCVAGVRPSCASPRNPRSTARAGGCALPCRRRGSVALGNDGCGARCAGRAKRIAFDALADRPRNHRAPAAP
jgi:hypothetical protein